MHPEYSEEDDESSRSNRSRSSRSNREPKESEHNNKKEKFEPIAGQQSELSIEHEFYCAYCKLKMKSLDHSVKCPKCGKLYQREDDESD